MTPYPIFNQTTKSIPHWVHSLHLHFHPSVVFWAPSLHCPIYETQSNIKINTVEISSKHCYNILYLVFPDCESLIRKMLVLDPSKRYSVENIKRHRWMVEEAPRLLPSTSSSTDEPNEQILRLMQSLGIDAIKTREVLLNAYYFFVVNKCYNTYLY